MDYRQGLNEILGGFLFLISSLPSVFDLTHSLQLILNLADSFISIFLINYYRDSSLYSIRSSYVMIGILLKYHDPQLSNYLSSREINPDIYCTSWIITYFVTKLQASNIFYLWNKVILSQSEYFLFYLCVAILIHFREQLMSKSQNEILFFISSIVLSRTDIDMIVKISLELKSITPLSYLLFIDGLKLFVKDFNMHKEIYFKADLANLEFMPVLTNEILKLCYPKKIKCVGRHRSSQSCKFCEKKFNDPNLPNEIYNQLKNYLIIDLKDSSNNQVILKDSMPITLNLQFSAKELVKKFVLYKNTMHFIIVTDNAIDLHKYNNIYKLRRLVSWQNEKFQSDGSTSEYIDIRPSKSNPDLQHRSINRNKSESNLLSTQENNYYQFKSLIDLFIEENFKFVSFAYKGFEDIHKKCIEYNIRLAKHESTNNSQDCPYCKNSSSLENLKIRLPSQGESFKEKIISNFVKLISSEDTNKFQKIKESKNEMADFPFNNLLASDEAVYECLSINNYIKRIDQLSFYFTSSSFSIFQKSGGKDFEPIDINIPFKSLKKINRLEKCNIQSYSLNDENIEKEMKELKGYYISEWINLEIKRFNYPVKIEYVSLSKPITLLVFFNNKAIIKDFETVALA